MINSLSQELVLYKRRIYRFSQKYKARLGVSITMYEVLELLDIIPATLLQPDRFKFATHITIENNFEDIIHYLNWLDSLAITVENNQYFVKDQVAVLVDHRELSLEEYLTDAQNMIYYPDVVINDIRNKVMRISKALTTVTDSDLSVYYQRRMSGFMSPISQTVFAIGEMAAMSNE